MALANFGSLLAPFTKLTRAINERGLKGAVLQLYTIGDLKFGEFKGTDKFGNRYYEDVNQPFGQHRWIEYANIHNPDPTLITPEWHGWMHHTYDEVPTSAIVPDGKYVDTAVHSDAIYNTHVSRHPDATGHLPHYNHSQYRHRGYKIKSTHLDADKKEEYYIQPGHVLHEKANKGGAFRTHLNADNVWDPESLKKANK